MYQQTTKQFILEDVQVGILRKTYFYFDVHFVCYPFWVN